MTRCMVRGQPQRPATLAQQRPSTDGTSMPIPAPARAVFALGTCRSRLGRVWEWRTAAPPFLLGAPRDRPPTVHSARGAALRRSSMAPPCSQAPSCHLGSHCPRTGPPHLQCQQRACTPVTLGRRNTLPRVLTPAVPTSPIAAFVALSAPRFAFRSAPAISRPPVARKSSRRLRTTSTIRNPPGAPPPAD